MIMTLWELTEILGMDRSIAYAFQFWKDEDG